MTTTQIRDAIKQDFNASYKKTQIESVIAKHRGPVSEEQGRFMSALSEAAAVLQHRSNGGALKSITWAYPENINAFSQFGRVVVFDTTYGTNRYGYALFVFCGVDNLGKTVCFGFALVQSEDADTVLGVLEDFKAIHNITADLSRHPTVLFTDCDQAFVSSIATAFPKSRHAWCHWHVVKHRSKYIKEKYKSEVFSSLLHKCVLSPLFTCCAVYF